jgi:hypothetical protein
LSGKASDDFWFSAGDWKGRIHVDTIRGDDDLHQSWQKRKHSRIGGVNTRSMQGDRKSCRASKKGITHLTMASHSFIRKAKKEHLRMLEKGQYLPEMPGDCYLELTAVATSKDMGLIDGSQRREKAVSRNFIMY